MRRHLSGTSSEELKCQFYIGPEPFWAWVCSVLGPQDSINELLNCVWAWIYLKSFARGKNQVSFPSWSKRHFLRGENESIYMGSNPLWAWVCSVLDPQDSIKELMNCVLRSFGRKNGSPMWTAAEVEMDISLSLWLYKKDQM